MSFTGRVVALVLVFAAGPFVWADGKKDDKQDNAQPTEDEQAVIDLTNAERAKADKTRKPLKMNPKLMDAARKHAENMAAQDKLEHGLDEKTPGARVKAAGYKYRAVGENIAWGGKGPADVVEGWMDSKIHRDNVLSPDYTEIGVGVAKNKKGEPYWVQVFGKQ